MAAVIGLLDILLCDDCLSSEQVNMVSQIRRCSTALLRLLNNILDISKVLYICFWDVWFGCLLKVDAFADHDEYCYLPSVHDGYIYIRHLSNFQICVRACTFHSDFTLFLSLQVESGKLLLEEADFDLNKELEGLVDMFSVQCIDHNIEIVLDLAGNSFLEDFVRWNLQKGAHI